MNQTGFWKNEKGVLDTLNKMVSQTLTDEATVQLQDLQKYRDDYLKTADGTDPDHLEAMRTINKYAKSGEKQAYNIATAEAQKLEQSYSNEIYDILKADHKTDDELKTMMNSKLYAVRNDFMDLCTLAVDTIHTEIKASEDNIQRSLEIFHNDGIKSRNLPKAFVPVVFPSVLGTFHNAFEGLQSTHQEAGYGAYVTEYARQVSTRLFERVEKQVTNAIKVLRENVKTLESTRGAKMKLLKKVNSLRKSTRGELQDIQDRIQRDFYEALPKFVEGAASPDAVANFCQTQYDIFSKQLNEIGEAALKTVLEIQDSLAEKAISTTAPSAAALQSIVASPSPVASLVPAASAPPTSSTLAAPPPTLPGAPTLPVVSPIPATVTLTPLSMPPAQTPGSASSAAVVASVSSPVLTVSPPH